MAVRNPTEWTQWQDERTIYPGQRIKTTTPSSVLNDQVYCLDAPQLVVGSSFYPLSAGVDAAMIPLRYYWLMVKRMCLVIPDDPVIPHTWGAYVWCDAGVTECKVGLYDALVSWTSTITIVGSTTAAWYQVAAPIDLTTDSEIDVILAARVSGGAGNCYVAGLYILSDET